MAFISVEQHEKIEVRVNVLTTYVKDSVGGVKQGVSSEGRVCLPRVSA